MKIATPLIIYVLILSFLERDIHQSMPPLNVGGGVGTLRDSGIGDDYPTPKRSSAPKDAKNGNMDRNGTDRSSFGMILKV